MKAVLIRCILCCSCALVLAAKKPNIVLIVADDYGFNDVGYHNSDMHTPNIDKLANAGVKLENYYVQPICTPSRSQLLTGRYQIHTGLQHYVILAPQRHCLPLDEVTLPEKLKEVGYKTHLIGKWHLGFYREECLPTHRGFDTHYGYYCGNQDYYTKNVCGPFGGWKYDGKFCGLDFHNNESPEWNANGTYSTYLYSAKASQVILEHDISKPLFMYLAYQSVHFPLQAPHHYIDMYAHVKDKNRRIYSAMVTAMDDSIGMIVDALASKGMMDDTLIVFTTDNGGQTFEGGSNWPLRGRKASLWEGGIRAVGFVHGYGVKNPGRISRDLFHISDWLPTLTHIAGGNTNGTKPLDGLNVWDAIANHDVPSPRTEILHNIEPLFKRPYGGDPMMKPYPNKYGINTTHGHAALRIGKWKLHTGDPGHDTWDPPPKLYLTQNIDFTCMKYQHQCDLYYMDDSSVRLYDIEADPEERSNVASIFPDIVDKMLSRLAEYNATAIPVVFPGPDKECNPALHGGYWRPWVA